MAEGVAWAFGVTLIVCILGAVVYILKGQKKSKEGKNVAATARSKD